jgi:hypothetical protein
MKHYVFILFLLVPLLLSGQPNKSYEEKIRNNSAIYHYWDGEKFYKVVIVKDSLLSDNHYLKIFNEKNKKLLYNNKITMYSTLEFLIHKEKNGKEVLILRTGGLSELRYKIFFGEKIYVKSYFPARKS